MPINIKFISYFKETFNPLESLVYIVIVFLFISLSKLSKVIFCVVSWIVKRLDRKLMITCDVSSVLIG